MQLQSPRKPAGWPQAAQPEYGRIAARIVNRTLSHSSNSATAPGRTQSPSESSLEQHSRKRAQRGETRADCCYSCRKALTGSMMLARRAGTKLAKKAAKRRSEVINAKVVPFKPRIP
jgi:hypothetical protein